jgi:hypothetical protein
LQDAPEPLGNDSNLMHGLVNGLSVTATLHPVNKTPLDWYSKKHDTVETATYRSEFVAARTCVEQIIDLWNTLQYLGVPIRSKSCMIGDNKSVVDSSMHVNAEIHSRHTSYHAIIL